MVKIAAISSTEIFPPNFTPITKQEVVVAIAYPVVADIIFSAAQSWAKTKEGWYEKLVDPLFTGLVCTFAVSAWKEQPSIHLVSATTQTSYCTSKAQQLFSKYKWHE